MNNKLKKSKIVKNRLNHSALRTAISRNHKVGTVLRDECPKTVTNAISVALKEAEYVVKKLPNIGSGSSECERVIPVPKIGGILPLVPIFAGLSALGELSGGSAAIVNAVVSANNAKKQLNESARRNQMMEVVAIGANKRGRGVFLKPYKSNFDLYMKEKSTKNNNSSKNY